MTKNIQNEQVCSHLSLLAHNYELKNCKFSTREIFIIYEIISGKNNAYIAKKLFLSYHTIKLYIQKLLLKTNSKNRTEMCAKILINLIGKDITPEMLAEHFM